MPVQWFIMQDEHRAVHRIDGEFGRIEQGNELLASVDNLLTGGIRIFELDFAKATYMSSYGIAVLIRLKKKLAARKADLVLMNVNKDIMRVLTVTRTDSYLLPQNDDETRQRQSGAAP